MSTNNKVFQVLVVPGTVAAMAAAGTTLDALATGAIGVFDAKTNLAINPNGSAIPERFYFAVKQANGEIDMSAGQEIQGKGINGITYKPYQAYVPFEAEVNGDFLTNLKPNSVYTLRLEVKSNEILQRQGTVQYTQAIVVETGDEVDVPTFLKEVKAQLDASFSTNEMFTFTIVDSADDSEVDVDSYSGDGTGIIFKIEGKPTFVNQVSDINTRFQNIRQTKVEVAFVDGYLDAGAKYEVTEEGEPEEGSGYNLRQREYFAGGWNGRPGVYRQSSVTGLALPAFAYRAKDGGKYNTFDIAYANHSNAGWGDYWNDIATTIAIDSEGAQATILTTALNAFLAAVVTKFNINEVIISTS